MFKKDRLKDPKKVAAGRAAHQKLRGQMSETGYRAFQRQCRAGALRRHPTMQQAGAASANRAQLREWGADGYTEQRQAAYRRCVEKHGEQAAKGAVRRATLQRRIERLHAPTCGEAALRVLLAEMGFTIHLDLEPFDYTRWRLQPLEHPLGPRDVLAEGGVGPYFCDLLLPILGLAIEVEGGVHVLNRERDARRRAYLEAEGLTVIVIPDTPTQALDHVAVSQQLAPLLLPHADRCDRSLASESGE